MPAQCERSLKKDTNRRRSDLRTEYEDVGTSVVDPFRFELECHREKDKEQTLDVETDVCETSCGLLLHDPRLVVKR